METSTNDPEYVDIECSRDGGKTWQRTIVKRTAPIVVHLTNLGSPYGDGWLDYRWAR